MTGAMRLLHGSGPQGPGVLALLGLLLTPVAATAGAVAAWRFGADAGWTGSFFIADGFLSHWQVWFAIAIIVESCAYSLHRGVAKQNLRLPLFARVRAIS
jgi:hypothetical protein